jgi:flagella basal body P-ring formation protein FlgA
MKCCRKSTRWFASAAIVLLAGTAGLRADTACDGAGPSGEHVRAAIEAAVRARVGQGARVSVVSCSQPAAAGELGPLVAAPDPSGRVGRPMRFVLSAVAPGRRPSRIGAAMATVAVAVDAARLSRPVARGAEITAADVSAATTDLAGLPLARVPRVGDVIGSRAERDLPPGALVMRSDIRASPLVRAGDVVRAIVRVGGVELAGSLVAAGNGAADDVIRVVNKDSRRAMRARVVRSGEVEVIDVR